MPLVLRILVPIIVAQVAFGCARTWLPAPGGDAGGGDAGGDDAGGDAPASLASRLAVGPTHTCASAAGQLKCWGRGLDGELGDGNTDSQSEATEVSGLSRSVVEVTAGGGYTCALLDDSSLHCWGDGTAGKLGGGSDAPSLVPREVTGLGDLPVRVEAGERHTCALLANGAVQCWGDNTSGALGTGTEGGTFNTPQDVQGLPGAAASISVGANHTCARLTDGQVACWGFSYFGQAGHISLPQATPALVADTAGNATAVSAGNGHTCALFESTYAQCWGAGSEGQLGPTGGFRTPTPTDAPVGSVERIVAGGWHTCCAVGADVQCWGAGDQGQLGHGLTVASSADPVTVPTLPSPVVAMDAGENHTCALLENDAVYCWGDGTEGKLGNNDTQDQNTPVRVQGFP